MNELTEFIQNNPNPRELKRALAVQMAVQKYTCFEIRDVLQVSVGFISKWKIEDPSFTLSAFPLSHNQGLQ